MYDFCIIGTGAAGGILAYQLAKSNFSVISLEQGSSLESDFQNSGRELLNSNMDSKDIQSMFLKNPFFADEKTRSSSTDQNSNFNHSQIFHINGLLNIWNGISIRFSKDDFSQWPIDYEDLESHYADVEKLITVCGTQENNPRIPDGFYEPPKSFRPADKLFLNGINQLKGDSVFAIPNRKAMKVNQCINLGECVYGCPNNSIYKFSSHLYPKIKSCKNYTLLSNTKAIRLIRDKKTNHITKVITLNTNTKKHDHILAKYFILAAGTFESPRLLLNSRDLDFPNGLANSHQQIGLFLQDNPKVEIMTSLMPLWGSKQDYELGYGDHVLVFGNEYLSNQEEAFNFIGQFCHHKSKFSYLDRKFQYFPTWLKIKIQKWLSTSLSSMVLFAPADPKAHNCLVTSSNCDQYGIPQVDIHYRMSPKETAMQNRLITLGRKLLRKSGGVFTHSELAANGTGIHYAGTCRMAHHPSQGVVKNNCQTFEHPNLFICDGSVIPRLPEKHLTLTIMALANRLAKRWALF